MFPNVAYIKANGECTGERILYNTIITVSHCIDKSYSSQRKFKVTYMDGETIRTEKVSFNKVKKLSKNLDKELSIFSITPKSSKQSFKATRVLPFEGNEEIIPKSVIIAGFGTTTKNNSSGKLRYGRSFYRGFSLTKSGSYRLYFQAKPKENSYEVLKDCIKVASASTNPIDGNGSYKELLNISESLKPRKTVINQAVCRGDSGGPVYFKTNEGELVLIGINSVGIYDKNKYPNLKKASDHKQCEAFHASAIVPLYSNRDFLEKYNVKVQIYD